MSLLSGVKVLEIAIYGFVPSAGAALGDWGAEVIKIEHPRFGDPLRGLVAYDVAPGTGGVTYLWETINRGKKSVAIDIATEDGRQLVLKLAEQADVFLTNFLPAARHKLGIDVDDIRARNPKIIYARGTANGPTGSESNAGGFDTVSYWSRCSLGLASRPADYDYPVNLPGPAFGDSQAGMHLAGGVAAALFHRERTGRASVVDTSLLGSGLWAMQASIAGTFVSQADQLPPYDRNSPPNPLVNTYRTADGRFVSLAMIEEDRYWPELCATFGRPELVTDPRFESGAARREHRRECVELLDEIFAERDLATWCSLLSQQEGQWAVVRTTREVLDDEQAWANGYFQRVDYANGANLPLVSAPVQFDETPPKLRPAPGHGEHTDEVLSGLVGDWDELVQLKVNGSVL